jgi:hypothetical protein
VRTVSSELDLYVAFGATSVRDEVLAPPGVEAATGDDEEKRLLETANGGDLIAFLREVSC